MADRDEKIVAVGFFTQPEFLRWGARLRHVHKLEDNCDFEDLITAIDKADINVRSRHPRIEPKR
jgi:hypothetical protein